MVRDVCAAEVSELRRDLQIRTRQLERAKLERDRAFGRGDLKEGRACARAWSAIREHADMLRRELKSRAEVKFGVLPPGQVIVRE